MGPAYFKEYFKASTTLDISDKAMDFVSTENDLLWNHEFKSAELEQFIPDIESVMTTLPKNFLLSFEFFNHFPLVDSSGTVKNRADNFNILYIPSFTELESWKSAMLNTGALENEREQDAATCN